MGMLVTLVVVSGMIVPCMIVPCMIVIQIVDFHIVIFQRTCGCARGEVVVVNIKGTACGCIGCGGQMSAFRRFWRVSGI